jgi:hypothetical protein
MDMELADTLPDGWQLWLEWLENVSPDNQPEIKTLAADRGNYLGYVRVVARRRGDARLEEYCWPDTLRSFPLNYTQKPLLRAPT